MEIFVNMSTRQVWAIQHCNRISTQPARMPSSERQTPRKSFATKPCHLGKGPRARIEFDDRGNVLVGRLVVQERGFCIGVWS